jgi:hypothetical protein
VSLWGLRMVVFYQNSTVLTYGLPTLVMPT